MWVGCGGFFFTHMPTNFEAKLLHLYNDVLSHGHILSSWSRTLFTMLAKHRQAALVTDFRPITFVRCLFYKIWACMILHRIQPCPDSFQPEEQHGFRAGRRSEKHLTVRVQIKLTTGHPNLLDQMLLTSSDSIPTPECLLPKFCRGTNLW